MNGLTGIRDVAERQLCLGCGACAYAQPDVIRMVDVLDGSRRPVVAGTNGDTPDTSAALAACPGVDCSRDPVREDGVILELLRDWGPVREMWEGHATDPDVRYRGSSGGAATAIALHAISRAGMHGVLHIAARDDVPYLNHTVMSTTRDDLLAATGSRYAPASPCDRLDLVENAPGPCVFIGKPCDVAATAKLRETRDALDERLGLTIAIFCAGTPSVRGTLELLRRMGIDDPSLVRSIRYRGKGWPGEAEAEIEVDGGGTETRTLTYDESWGDVLQQHRQWRCHVCADHTGEFADIAVGDPWYRDIQPGEAGSSLVLARTERGRDALHAAIEDGAVDLERVPPGVLPASQPNLLRTRGAVWGRITTSRAMGVPAPRYDGLPMKPAWRRHLTVKEQAQSIYGTAKRVFTRDLRERHPVRPYDPNVDDGRDRGEDGEAPGDA